MTKLIKVLMNKDTSCLPVWFMRQAGRYLPEFQEIRSQNKDFIKLCLNSNLSSEITLQPIKRFNLDAAIIFSDILIIPHILKQKVKFEKETGPILSTFEIDKFLNFKEETIKQELDSVYKAINAVKKKLDKSKSLIGFVGSPWTLIAYMYQLKNNTGELNLDLLKNKKKEINIIIEKLNRVLCSHIQHQMEAGADVVQIFDSWAGLLPQKDLDNFCFKPNQEIVNFCKKNSYPVICFPKGIKKKYKDFSKIVKPDGISIDYDVDPEWIRQNINNVCIQGGMDPKTLLANENEIYKEAEKYIKIFKDYPYIFNLGHGLLPDTNPDNVKKLINFVSDKKNGN